MDAHPSQTDLVRSFAERAFGLPSPHGSDCPCLSCADGRRALGHKPLAVEFSVFARRRQFRMLGEQP
jgi:hypothetical protein